MTDDPSSPPNDSAGTRQDVPDASSPTRLVMPRSVAGTAAPAPGAPPPTQRHLLRNRYLLEQLIGQGAMGEVWRARDRLAEEAADRNPYVAIKLLNMDLDRSPEAAKALYVEASRAQKLAHPNIATVYLFDQDERTRQVFMVMELLEGKPLDRVISEVVDSGLRPREALPLIRDMAAGLGYAHRNGLVHSDIKPSNIFVTREGTAKVLDFGIARVVQVAAAEAQPWADDSVFTGYTASYASPEAIRTKEPLPADDVFSLGLVAYQLLTGYHPFDGRPSTEAVEAGLRPKPIKGLKRREWAAIEKSLAFERTNRFADAGAFARALEGASRLYQAFAGLAALSLVAAGVFWYRGYQATQPAVPLEQLSAQTQAQVRDALREGDESLRYLESSGDITASADAAQFFAEAYALHVRDPDAVAGLEKAANLAIAWYRKQGDRAMAADELRKFQAKSEFYRTYRPLQQAIDESE